MYYVRKLSKPSSLFKITHLQKIGDLDADFLGQEMRTSGNTLSVWRSETLEKADLYKAIKAALLSSTQINASQFIIIDSDALAEAKIATDDHELGKTAYKGLEHLHTNLCELTYEKIGVLLKLYKDVCGLKERTPKIEKKEFKDIIHEANALNVLDISVLEEHMQKEITQLLSKPIVR